MTAPRFAATAVQERLVDAAVAGDAWLIGFGGGIRGTKTWGTLSYLVALCRMFPGSRWAVVRRDLERIKKSTIPSFEKLITLAGGFVTALNRTDWVARCANGSEVMFFGENIDRDPELLRWHGFEVNGFLLEEADELSERSFVKAIERAGTWLIPGGGEQPPPYVFATFNPCSGWPRRRFYVPWRDGTLRRPYAFIPSTAADNPFISDQQRIAWKEMSENEYKRFVLGDWESISGAYYDTLEPTVHLINRDELPTPIPKHWRHWGAFDWGYKHWAVMGAFVTDEDGTDYLLKTIWLRLKQDDELAKEYAREMPPACLKRVYAGGDCWAKVRAHGASGISVAEVFNTEKIVLIPADLDLVNGGRATNRVLKVRDGRAGVYFVREPGNLRVFDQLGEIMPDETDIRKPGKIDATLAGEGGDDGADMFRYGMATRVRAATLPAATPSAFSPDVLKAEAERSRKLKHRLEPKRRTKPIDPDFGEY